MIKGRIIPFGSGATAERLIHWLIRPNPLVRTLSVTLNGYSATLEREVTLVDGTTMEKWSTAAVWTPGQRITAVIVFEEG